MTYKPVDFRASKFDFKSGNAQFSGNVGIGRTPTDAELDVNGNILSKRTTTESTIESWYYDSVDNTNSSRIRISTNSSRAAVFLDAVNGDFVGSDYVGIKQEKSTKNLRIDLGVNANADIIFGNIISDFMTITSAGNVGIGTTNASDYLSGVPGLAIANSSYSGLSLAKSTNNFWLTWIDTSDNLAFYKKTATGSITPFKIHENYVEVLASDNYPLRLTRTDNLYIEMKDTGNSTTGYIGVDDNGLTLYSQNASTGAKDFRFYSGSTNTFELTNTGIHNFPESSYASFYKSGFNATTGIVTGLTELEDNRGEFSSDKFTASESGRYVISIQFETAGYETITYFGYSINGTLAKIADLNSRRGSFTYQATLTSGDYVQPYISCTGTIYITAIQISITKIQ